MPFHVYEQHLSLLMTQKIFLFYLEFISVNVIACFICLFVKKRKKNDEFNDLKCYFFIPTKKKKKCHLFVFIFWAICKTNCNWFYADLFGATFGSYGEKYWYIELSRFVGQPVLKKHNVAFLKGIKWLDLKQDLFLFILTLTIKRIDFLIVHFI